MRTRYGRYEVLRRLGAGSFGEVFLARDPDLDREVAVKVVEGDRVGNESLELLLREARAAAGLQHPHLVTVHDVGREGMLGWVVMEYVSGETLLDRLRRGSMEPAEVVAMGGALCAGLTVAHARGIVHRDLKPANILLSPDGSPKIVDFGLAHAPGSASLDGSGGIIGTLAYVSPEQAMSENVDGGADLFSLAIVLFEALTGQHPFLRTSEVATLYAILNDPPTVPPGHPLTEGFQRFFARGLAKERASRFEDAEAFARGLLEAAGVLEPAAAAAPMLDTFRVQRPRFESALVGRDTELRVLLEHVGEAHRGSGGTVLLSGEAGIGKSRLLTELAHHAESHGFMVLRGRALLEGGPAYHPWSQIMAQALRADSGGTREMFEEFLRQHPDFAGVRADSLRRLLHLGGGSELEATGPDQIWEATVATLETLAREQPLLVLLDDLHWSDQASLRLFRYAAARVEGLRCLVVGAYRPEESEGESGSESVAEIARLMSREECVTPVSLSRLDRESTGAMVAELLRDRPREDRLEGRIFHETEGNPLFILEVAKMVAGGSEPGDTLTIPTRVVDVVQHRLDRLNDQERDALEIAAIEGEYFHVEPIGTLLEMTRFKALKLLQGLEHRHHVVRPADQRFRFDHAKLRDVILSRIPPGLRREYHRVVADCLLESHPNTSPAVLAYHLEEAGEAARALASHLAAASAARRVFANEDALRHLQQALATLEQAGASESARIPEVRLSLGEVQLQTGSYPEAAEQLQQAIQSAQVTPAVRMQSLVRMGETQIALASYDAARDWLEQARQESERAGERTIFNEALIASARLYTRRGEFQQALEACGRSEELCRETGEERPLVQALVETGEVFLRRGEFLEAQRRMELAHTRAQDSGDLWGEARACNGLAMAARQLGDFDAALRHLEASRALSGRIGDRQGEARALGNSGNIHLNRGDWQQARACYTPALRTVRALSDRRAEAILLNNMGLVLSMGGEYEEASRVGGDCLLLMRELEDPWDVASALDNLGALAHRRGRVEEARERFRECAQLRRTLGDRAGLVGSLLSMSLLEHGMRNPQAAQDLAREALEACGEDRENELVARGLLMLADPGAPRAAREAACVGLQEAAGAAQQRGDAELRTLRALIMGELLVHLSRWDELHALVQPLAGDSDTRGMRHEAAWARLLQARSAFEYGRVEEALREGRLAREACEQSDLWGMHWEVSNWMAERFGEDEPELWRAAAASLERFTDVLVPAEKVRYLGSLGARALLSGWRDRAARCGAESARRTLEGTLLTLGC